MKIAHLISSGGLFGAEKVMLRLAAALKQQGHRTWVVAIENRHNPHLEVIEEARRLGLETHIIISGGRFDLNTAGKLADFIRENKVEIIHTHNYKANLLAFLAARKVRVSLVATLHGYIGEGWKLKVYEAFDRWLMRFFDKVVLVDASLKKWFQGKPVSLVVINNGIDTQEFKPSNKNAKNEELVIGTVGRMSAEKGCNYLLEAFAEISKSYPKTQLLFVGDGVLRNELENMRARLGVRDRCDFAGFQADVKPFYEKMDIFVSSSLLEHFPMVVLEAMACGKAIVATDVGGTKDLIKDRQTGLLIKSASPQEIGNALIELLKDKPLRESLGENARRFVAENFSIEKMVELYKKVYEEVLG